MTGKRLTGAQVELARDLAAHPGHVWDGYPPLKALLAAGYAEKVEGRFSDIYRLTPAGRIALSEAEET